MAATKGGTGRCIVCGKETRSDDYRDVPIYCEEHRNHIQQDSRIIEEAPLELYFALVTQIFIRAREDYLYNSDGMRSDAEVFFRSEWAQILSVSGYDPGKLIEMLDEEIEYGLEQDHEDSY